MEDTPSTNKEARKASEMSKDQLLTYIKQQKQIIKKQENLIATLKSSSGGKNDEETEEGNSETIESVKESMEVVVKSLQQKLDASVIALENAKDVHSFEIRELESKHHSQLNALKEQLSHVTNKYNVDMQESNQMYQELLRERKDANHHHEIELHHLNDKLLKLEIELNASTNKFEVHMREKKSLLKELNDKYDTLNKEHSDVLRMKANETSIAPSVDIEQISIELYQNLESKYKALQEDVDDHHMELDKYRRRVLELEQVEEDHLKELLTKDELYNELQLKYSEMKSDLKANEDQHEKKVSELLEEKDQLSAMYNNLKEGLGNIFGVSEFSVDNDNEKLLLEIEQILSTKVRNAVISSGVSDLTVENEQLHKQLKELQNQISTSDTLVKQLQDELTRAEVDLKALEDELDQCELQHKQEVDKIIDDCVKRYESVTSETEALSKSLVNKAIDECKSKYERQLEGLIAEKQQLDAELKLANDQISDHEKNVNAKLSNSSAEMAEKNALLTEMKLEIENINRTNDIAIENLNDHITQKQEIIKTLEANVQSLQEKVDVLEKSSLEHSEVAEGKIKKLKQLLTKSRASMQEKESEFEALCVKQDEIIAELALEKKKFNYLQLKYENDLQNQKTLLEKVHIPKEVVVLAKLTLQTPDHDDHNPDFERDLISAGVDCSISWCFVKSIDDQNQATFQWVKQEIIKNWVEKTKIVGAIPNEHSVYYMWTDPLRNKLKEQVAEFLKTQQLLQETTTSFQEYKTRAQVALKRVGTDEKDRLNLQQSYSKQIDQLTNSVNDLNEQISYLEAKHNTQTLENEKRIKSLELEVENKHSMIVTLTTESDQIRLENHRLVDELTSLKLIKSGMEEKMQVVEVAARQYQDELNRYKQMTEMYDLNQSNVQSLNVSHGLGIVETVPDDSSIQNKVIDDK